LVLPLAVTLLSIFTRAADIKSYESVLKISNDITIGIISFDIWAISAKSSDHYGRVMVNPTTMISGDFVIPLLLSGLLISVGCVVLTHYKFSSPITRQRLLLVGFSHRSSSTSCRSAFWSLPAIWRTAPTRCGDTPS
jgi:hypothetical protein